MLKAGVVVEITFNVGHFAGVSLHEDGLLFPTFARGAKSILVLIHHFVVRFMLESDWGLLRANISMKIKLGGVIQSRFTRICNLSHLYYCSRWWLITVMAFRFEL